MVGAHQAGEVVRKEPLLKEVVLHEVGEVAHGEVDVAALETARDVPRRHGQRTDRGMRRGRTQALDEPRQENDFADIGQRERKCAGAAHGIEGLLGQEIFLEPRDEGPRSLDQRMGAWRGLDAASRADEQRIVEMRAQLAQRHADGRLAHAERFGRRAHAALIIERKGDGQQIEV